MEVFKIGHGHTSPSGMPPNERREGQIVFNPSSKANQRVVIGTFLASPSRLESFSRKSNVRVQKLLKYEMQSYTDDVSWSSINSKELWACFEGFAKVE